MPRRWDRGKPAIPSHCRTSWARARGEGAPQNSDVHFSWPCVSQTSLYVLQRALARCKPLPNQCTLGENQTHRALVLRCCLRTSDKLSAWQGRGGLLGWHTTTVLRSCCTAEPSNHCSGGPHTLIHGFLNLRTILRPVCVCVCVCEAHGYLLFPTHTQSPASPFGRGFVAVSMTDCVAARARTHRDPGVPPCPC